MPVAKSVSARVSVVVLERWLGGAGYDVALDVVEADVKPALVIVDVADPQ